MDTNTLGEQLFELCCSVEDEFEEVNALLVSLAEDQIPEVMRYKNREVSGS